MVDLSDLWLRPTEGVERVSGRRKSLVKSLPTNVTESGSSVRWTIETYLELIEEFACSPEAFGTGGPARGETVERIRRAVGKKDGSAEERAIVDRMRVEVREYWQNFPKLQLLGEHYRRAALRREGRGSPGSTEPPSEEEGRQLARALLAHVPGRALRTPIPGADRFDVKWESEALAKTLAGEWLRARSRPMLQDYIKLSQSSPVYFGALELIWDELNRRGEAIPKRLTEWRQEVDGGRLKRPLKKPIPAQRPVTLPKYLSDLNIQLTIEILRRIGIKPEGGSISGCQMVTEALAISKDEALHLSVETVRRIWQKRTWEGSFKPVMVKYAKPLDDRHGPFPTHPRA